MKVTFVQPTAELKPYVEAFWVMHSPFGLPEADASTVAPNGCAKLIIPCENSIVSVAGGTTSVNRANEIYFVGNQDRATRLYTSREKTIFIVIEFAPQGAYPIFGMPMAETHNGLFDVSSLFGKWGREVTKTTGTLPTLREKVAAAQDRLIRLLRSNGGHNAVVAHCVDAVRASNGRVSIAELERSTGYSRRYLDVLFQRYVGVSPKTFAGITRFQKFYKQWALGESFDQLKSELYEYYYDQAHFTKEFRKLTGYSPAKYMREIRNEFGRRIIGTPAGS